MSLLLANRLIERSILRKENVEEHHNDDNHMKNVRFDCEREIIVTMIIGSTIYRNTMIGKVSVIADRLPLDQNWLLIVPHLAGPGAALDDGIGPAGFAGGKFLSAFFRVQ